MGVIYRTSEIGIMFTNVHITKGGHHLVVAVGFDDRAIVDRGSSPTNRTDEAPPSLIFQLSDGNQTHNKVRCRT